MTPRADLVVGTDTLHESAPPAGDIQRLETANAILDAASSCQGSPLTGFQTKGWLSAVYKHLVTKGGGRPLGVLASLPGGCRFLLPLYVERLSGVSVARFADCGVSDYNSPLGECSVDAKQLLAKLKPSLHGVDVLVLERMPHHSANPLTQHPWATASRHNANIVQVPDGVDAFVRLRGKKFRKEVERCTRVLASHGPWTFARAQTPSEIDTAFAALERQQGERHAGKGADYQLAAPQYAAFYRDVIADRSGFSYIFTLSVNSEIIAVLFGIVHHATFTLLRIANGGEAWKHVSPGRFIVVETMRYFQDKGVKEFDMGIGDYPFKRAFGADPTPLCDLVVPLTLRGLPYAATFHLKTGSGFRL
jgi:CelD/BcsL family acetyltransferase involved in cellulose biosynthesis